MRLNWVLLPREPGGASFYGVFKRPAYGVNFLAGFAGLEAVA